MTHEICSPASIPQYTKTLIITQANNFTCLNVENISEIYFKSLMFQDFSFWAKDQFMLW